jgi:hypothetical protein
MIDIGIFEEIENTCRNNFESKFTNEVEVFNQLLNVYEAFIKATSDNIKDNDYPNWTILMLLSQTLPLMNNGVNLLSAGYLRSSEIMIRVAAEAIILSLYFKEFPETEIEYRTTNYRDFFHNHSIDKMLKKVEKEGTIFIKNKEKAKQVKWNKIVFENLFKESSKFLHNNPDLIYSITLNNDNTETGHMIMGPQEYNDETLSMGLRRLFNTLLFSLVALGMSLNISADDTEKSIMEKSSQIIENLNKPSPELT